MKTLGYLVLTCLASGSALYEGLRLKNNILLFLLATGVWVLYIWTVQRRIRKMAERRLGERLFEEHMRSSFQTRIKF